MIATVKETIEILQRNYGNALDETLVVTWWDSTDFQDRDLDKAFNVCEDALDVCIGHISDTIADFVPALSEEDSDANNA
jgi:hypothetical protein